MDIFALALVACAGLAAHAASKPIRDERHAVTEGGLQRVMSKALLTLAVALSVAGCDKRSTVYVAPGEYELTYTEPLANRSAANILLDYEAQKVCPNGYRVLNDEVRPGAEHPLYYWRISCLPADGSDTAD